jgi:hypothetical protein
VVCRQLHRRHQSGWVPVVPRCRCSRSDRGGHAVRLFLWGVRVGVVRDHHCCCSCNRRRRGCRCDAEASNANLQIMFTLNCCNGPCANPASGSGSPTSCDDCGVCCSANTYCQATTRLGLNDAWGDPQTQGAFCPYKSLKNGTVRLAPGDLALCPVPVFARSLSYRSRVVLVLASCRPRAVLVPSSCWPRVVLAWLLLRASSAASWPYSLYS